MKPPTCQQLVWQADVTTFIDFYINMYSDGNECWGRERER